MKLKKALTWLSELVETDGQPDDFTALRTVEAEINQLQKDADHFRHLATDTIADREGTHEMPGFYSDQTRTYVTVPDERYRELKSKAEALDTFAAHLQKLEEADSLTTIAALDICLKIIEGGLGAVVINIKAHWGE